MGFLIRYPLVAIIPLKVMNYTYALWIQHGIYKKYIP